MIQTKPAAEPKRASDGYRILIEPNWPKSLPKGKVAGVDWMKELYPSRNLQDWVRRNPRKIEGFKERYLLELAQKDDSLEKIGRMHRDRGTITILTVPMVGDWDVYDTLVAFLEATVV